MWRHSKILPSWPLVMFSLTPLPDQTTFCHTLDGWPEPFGPENSTEENYVSGGFSTIIILLLSCYDYMFT